ncbi:hypothetical protein [Streptomyces sp. MJM1172]|uniref:hypothetical protein n=1 Tax=Streptomyces sp. MJM1172 TaxID=1703926 RepID=UPI00093C7C99|nr:hypothetical protein [Streptomyces sp. MJM1172]OKI61520.1 hypothetical protein AMK15_18555 [Streptomyces sp. MJM1172]
MQPVNRQHALNRPTDAMYTLDEHTPYRHGRYEFTPLPLIQRGLAHHEAGHVVLGQLVGFTCERVRIHTITRGGVTGWTGVTTWARSFGTYLDIAVVCGAAGQAADLHQLTESGRLTPETATLTVTDHDKQMALNILTAEGVQVTETGPAPDGGLAWDHVMATAQQIVDREWARITAVANALLAAPNFTLTGTQAAQIAGITTA